MKKYQNTLQTAVLSQFVEVGTYSGAELAFKAARPEVKIAGQAVTFAKGSVALRMPHDVVSCTNACVLGTVTESLNIDFNVVSVESLDVLKAEVDRIYLLTKEALVHGVLPPVYSDFSEA